jgi:hypothetical protein
MTISVSHATMTQKKSRMFAVLLTMTIASLLVCGCGAENRGDPDQGLTIAPPMENTLQATRTHSQQATTAPEPNSPQNPGKNDSTAANADPGDLPASAGDMRTYVVKAGDAGLWGISKIVYGKGAYWMFIARANPGVNPARLRPGNILVIPPKPAPATRPRTKPKPSPFDGNGPVRVAPASADHPVFE